jgi:hypothetical protein
MYQAELRGKLSSSNEEKEDILTSNVFSFLKYSNRTLFLSGFLHLLKIQVTNKAVEKAKFEFWPQYDDHTEPDVIVIVGPYYLLFEAKYLSDFGEETERLEGQIIRELKQGLLEAENNKKRFFYIPITANYVHPASILEEAPIQYHRYCKWINWQKVAQLINSILLDNSIKLPPGERDFANDLYQLLIKKKLGAYSGISLFDQKPITHFFESIFFFSRKEESLNEYFGFFKSIEFPKMKIQRVQDIYLPLTLFSALESGERIHNHSLIFKKDNENGKKHYG